MSRVHSDDMFLLELLMDANRKANGWQDFLEAFRLHFNLHTCHLYIENIKTLMPCFQYWSGVGKDELAKQKYIEKHFINDLDHLPILNGDLNSWHASNLPSNYSKDIPPAALSQYDIEHICGSTVFKDDPWVCVFIHTRRSEQGEYQQSEIDRFSALSIYIEKAIKLRLHLSENKSNRSRLRSVLNQFHLPVATLNEFGEVVAQNRLMDFFLEKQEFLAKSKDRHLLINNGLIDKQLQTNIQQTISFAKDSSQEHVSDPVIINPRNDAPYIIGLQELLEQDDNTGEIFVGALVYAASSTLISNSSKQQIQSLFSLTNAESQVAHLFSQYMNVKEVARHECKSVATVREQIQTCFKKTKTSSQLELINLLASLPISE